MLVIIEVGFRVERVEFYIMRVFGFVDREFEILVGMVWLGRRSGGVDMGDERVVGSNVCFMKKLREGRGYDVCD